MKTTIPHRFFYLLLLLMCIRCSSPMPVGLPVTPTPPKSQLSPSSETVLPKVIRATFTGVPTENIRVDTLNQTVTIALPDNYFVVKPTLSLTLSCTDCAIQYAPKETPTSLTLSMSNIGGSYDSFGLSLHRSGSSLTNTYIISVRQDNPLLIEPVTGPLQAELGGPDEIPIPVKNYLDGTNTEAWLFNIATGKRTDIVASVCSDADYNCTQAESGKVYLHIGSVVPGAYTITLKKSTGRLATSPYPLLVSRGKSQFSGVGVPILLNQQEAGIYGLNLYQDNHPTLVISNLAGYLTEIPLRNFTENTQQAAFALPADLKPGNYWARVRQENGVLSASKRFGVLSDYKQPYLFYIYDDHNERVDFDQISDKIRLSREKKYYAVVSLSPRDIKKHQVKLVDVTDTQKVILIDMYVDEKYYLGGSDYGVPPSFIIPNTVAPGLYRMSFLVGIDANTVRETSPFEQIFMIQ